MSKKILVSMSQGGVTTQVQQDEVGVSKDLRKEIKAGLSPDVATPDMPVSEATPELDAGEKEPLDPGAEADKIIGRMAQSSEKEQLAILDELGVGFTDLDEAGGENWEPYKAAISKALSKRTKQDAITPAAAVIESGQPPPSGDAEIESLQNELQGFYAGDHGSLSTPKNQKRVKEISKELNKLSPPVQT